VPEQWRRHTAEDRARVVETIRRRAAAESRSVSSLVAEYKISQATYQNWLRAYAAFFWGRWDRVDRQVPSTPGGAPGIVCLIGDDP
jgi:hypothetical protein